MKPSIMKKGLVLVLAILCLLPAAPVYATGAGHDGGRAVSDHSGIVTVSNFTGMQTGNLTTGADGSLALGTGPGAWKNEIKVADYGNEAKYPAVAAMGGTGYVVSWTDDHNMVNSGYDLFAQRYKWSGDPLGPAMDVCTMGGEQEDSCIAVNSGNDIMVAWQDYRNGGNANIYAQMFDRAGSKLGADIRVHSTDNYQANPAAAANSQDRFLAVWSDARDYGASAMNIYAQLFEPNGSKRGDEITITVSGGEQNHPDVAADAGGGFIVTWQDRRSLDNYDIYALRLDGNGAKVGNEFIVNSAQKDQTGPKVAAAQNGDFMIVWTDVRNGGPDVYGQRFDSAGSKLGPEVAVVVTTSSETNPDIVADSDSRYYIAWNDNRDDNGDIYSSMYDPITNIVGAQTVVVKAAEIQQDLELAISPKDDLVAVWTDGRTLGTAEIYARTYVFPYLASGTVVTGDLSGPDLWRWTDLTMNATLQNPSANTVSFEHSTDAGATWKPVPANGSLAAALSATLRLRATLATTDSLTSPILRGITSNYIANRPAVISPLQNLTGLKGAVRNITAQASDPDGDTLNYSWAQTGGPAVNLTGASTVTLCFIPAVSGDYVFRLVVNDGYNDSAPATFRCTVQNRPPDALLRVSTKKAMTGAQVEFDATGSKDADDNIASYNFNFGDGSESGWITKPKVKHAYAKDGTYSVSVTVRDEEGNATASDPVTLKVEKAGTELPIMLILTIVIIIVVIAMAAVLMMRRKKPTQVIQYQPPQQAAPPPAPPQQMAPPPAPQPAQPAQPQPSPPPQQPPAVPPSK